MKGCLDVPPSTVYLLMYQPGKCSANCQFCSQARSSTGRSDHLSRVTWPAFAIDDVVSSIHKCERNGIIKRICIQAVNYQEAFEDTVHILETIRSKVTLPISLSCQPFNEEQLQTLFDLGLDRVAIPLDAATEEVFSKVKGQLSGGPYSWHRHLSTLRSAVEIFGEGHVSTHLIVGLGESDAELIIMIQMMVDTGINPGLFAFTPIQGTLLEKSSQPSLVRYRRIQVARYLIASGKAKYSMMKFGPEGNLVDCGIPLGDLNEISASGEPFLTSGCPDCNRPFYNEKAGGPFYNYPRKPTRDEISQIITEMSFREG